MMEATEVSFDSVWGECLKIPRVWPADVSANITQHCHEKEIAIVGT